jgi:predicted  nucleic acid-binding Zn-ribbon protein
LSREDQRQQIFQLVALRDVDAQRAQTMQLIASVPRVLAARRRNSQAAAAGFEGAREKLLGFRSHLKSLELDLAKAEEAVNKANANLLTAKTNQEYTLLLSEISRKREDMGKVEETIIEQYDVIKQGEMLVEDAEARVKEAEAEFKAFEDRAHTEMAEHQREQQVHDDRREQIRRAIDAEVLKIYDRTYKAHGEAVSPVVDNICQGCFSSMTPNDRSRMISGRELVSCRSCQRIVFLPEVLQASST